ncbi:Uncharacterised protein [Bordetella pertussis]|nr:Uncharacterised protein [Bordetella pertussis]
MARACAACCSGAGRGAQPRSPPCPAEPVSCEFLRASSANPAGSAAAWAAISCALAAAALRASSEAPGGMEIMMWLTRRRSGWPKRDLFCS